MKLIKKINQLILPQSNLGKWSLGLIVLFFVFLGIFFILVASGQRGGATFFSNTYLTIPFLSAAFSGIAAFFVGVVAIFKKKDYTFLVFVATLIGLFVLFFCSAELIFPH